MVVTEIDRILAECRAITFALKEGYQNPEVVAAKRVDGAWVIDLLLPRGKTARRF